MIAIYVGDASNLRRRIQQHGRGNVEGSALRKHVAEALGYGLARTRRPSGSTRVRIDAPDPRAAEGRVDAYLQGGGWRWVTCKSPDEARELQWVAIEALNPALNRDRRTSPPDSQLADLVRQLRAAPAVPYAALDPPATPGVYALYHARLPT